MIIVDTEIAKRIEQNKPIKVAMFGAGYSAKHIASQIISSFPAIQLCVIVNRTVENAKSVLAIENITEPLEIETANELTNAITNKTYAVTSSSEAVFECSDIDAVIETTGEVEYGAFVSLNSIKSKKHTIVLNCEMDATVGPILKKYADDMGVIYSNTDGDEPGVASNLARYVRSIGLEVVGAGNVKGFYDVHRTPETQKEFAEANNQKPHMMTSFVDGTKLAMELTVLGNALGFGVGKRGMHGPSCDDVRTAIPEFPDGAFSPGNGIVDFTLGASPYTGAWIVGHTEHPMKMDYLKYLKMGDGPYYMFYTPYHLPQLDIPISVARAVLCNDATVTPLGAPTCEALTVAKRDLKAGEILDGIGGFMNYGLIDNFKDSLDGMCLPMGLSVGCKLIRDIPIDQVITYNDVELPEGRVIDTLRTEMIKEFF